MRTTVTAATGYLPITEIPGVLLVRWRLLEGTSADGRLSRRIVGVSPDAPGQVIVTSSLTAWDWHMESAETSDGTMYFLGRSDDTGPGDDEVTDAFATAASRNGCADVTDRVVANGGVWPVVTH